jgi:ABC-type Fe3+ transport system substrate-binding protein
VLVYSVALVAASANPDAAFFLAYLTSRAATKIFLETGFRSLVEAILAPSQNPVVSQFEFQQWVRRRSLAQAA